MVSPSRMATTELLKSAANSGDPGQEKLIVYAGIRIVKDYQVFMVWDDARCVVACIGILASL